MVKTLFVFLVAALVIAPFVGLMFFCPPRPPEPPRPPHTMSARRAENLIEVWHDDARGVTCWIVTGNHEHAVSCLPDTQLKGAQ